MSNTSPAKAASTKKSSTASTKTVAPTCSCSCCHDHSEHQLALDNGELMPGDDIEVLAAFFKALSDPSRLNIVYLLLKHQQLSVSDIANKTNMSLSAVSHQLATLRMRKLVTVKRDGVKNYYRLCDDHVFQVIATAIEHIKEE